MKKTVLLNSDGQPLNQAFSYRRNFEKTVESLLGLVRGVLADGELSDAEIGVLAAWCNQHPEVVTQWPGSAIACRVRSVLSDGEITSAEKADLTQSLQCIVGGSVQETGMPAGLSIQLPVDPCDKLLFRGATYCFTGKFLYGTRDACEQTVIDRGARISSDVTINLSYLVIGALASQDWIHTSYGRKIEKAIGYKRQGRAITVLAEERWTALLDDQSN